MTSKAMSLKAKIKNYAKNNNIAAQVVLQNYMFECLLARLAVSEYNDKFVVKGGMLIAAIVGLDTRSTMDLDTTIRNIPLTEEKIKESLNKICSIDLDDDIKFVIKSITSIRKDDIYGGYSVRIDAIYDTITTPLAIDISTGDVITPDAIKYEFRGIFDDNKKINLWGYNIETVMAEKVETILRRSTFNTRPRDFYDVYILGTTQGYDKSVFKNALEGTAKHRGSIKVLDNVDDSIDKIARSNELKVMWEKYQRKFAYAKDIEYRDVIEVLNRMVNQI